MQKKHYLCNRKFANRGVAQLAARHVRDVEVGSSSLLTPTYSKRESATRPIPVLNFYVVSDIVPATSVAAEDVASIHLVFHVIQQRVVAVGDDGIGELLEPARVVYHL